MKRSPRRRLDSTPVKLTLFLGAAGSELLIHALHMLSAPVLTAFVESHMAESERHTMWHDALVDWLPSGVTVAGLILLYKHLHAHTAIFYVRKGLGRSRPA